MLFTMALYFLLPEVQELSVGWHILPRLRVKSEFIWPSQHCQGHATETLSMPSLLVRFIPEKLIFCEVLWSSSGRGEGQWICWPPAPSYPQLPQSFHLHSSTCVGWQILISTSGIFLLFSWCSCSATGWTDSGHGTGYKLQPPCALGLVGNGPFLLSSNNWSHTI